MKEIDKLEVMRLVDIELDPCPKCGDYLVPCRCKLKDVEGTKMKGGRIDL